MTFFPGDAAQNDAAGIAPFGNLRIAQISPDAAAPNVDICVKPIDYPTWDSGTSQAFNGVAYKTFTGNRPLSISSGYDVKVMPANSPADCAATPPGATVIATTNEVTEATNVTWAITGHVGGGDYDLAVRFFANHDEGEDSSSFNTRFVFAADNLTAIQSPVRFGVYESPVLTVSTPSVLYGTASPYETMMYAENDHFGLDTNGTPSSAEYDFSLLPPGSVYESGATYTAWAVGDGSSGSTTPVQLVLCRDSETDAQNLLTCITLEAF